MTNTNSFLIAESDQEANHGLDGHLLNGTRYMLVDSFSRKKKGRRKSFLCPYSVFATAALLVLTIVLFVTHHDRLLPSFTDSQLCLSPTCIRVSNTMLEKINTSIDPCTDFYEFACGKWISETVPFEGMPNWMELVRIAIDVWQTIRDKINQSQFDSLSSSQKKAAKIYKSCMNTNALARLKLAPLKRFLESSGGWNLLESSSNLSQYDSSWDFQKSLLELHSKVLYPLFRIAVEVDARNTSRHILSIHQPVLMFPGLRHYINGTTGKAVTDIGKSTLRYLLSAINITANGLGATNPKAVVEEAKRIAMFEAEIAMTMKNSQVRDQSEFHVVTTLAELNTQAPFIEWTSFVQGLYQSQGLSITMHPNEAVTFGDRATLAWLRQLSSLIQNYLTTSEKRKTVDNYLKWRAIIVLMGFLDSAHLDDPTEIIKSFTQQNHARWIICMLRTTEVMGMPLASLFLQMKPISRTAKQMVENLAKTIIEAMKQEIDQIDWMDQNTKKTAISKVHETLALVGYSEKLLDVKRLDKEFSEVKVDSVNFMSNMLQGLMISRKQELKTLREPPIRSHWDREIALLKPNAYYNFEGNRIVIPMAIIAPYLFVANAPNYFNYGAIGSIVGHELTHGFDYKGRTYGEHGNIRPWWSDRSAKEYAKRSRCLIDQYFKYNLSSGNRTVHVNGTRTFSENLADNGGLKIAYKAYKEDSRRNGAPYILPGLNMTADQTFFLSFAQAWCSKSTDAYRIYQLDADPHAPERFRVLGPLQNMPEFSKAFQCSKKSKMDPKMKCSSLW